KNNKSVNETLETSDKKITIDQAEKGTTYQFEVIAHNTETDLESEPATIELKIDDEDLGRVSNLKANYQKSNQSIDVSWVYDGDVDHFEVTLNGQSETTTDKNISFNGIDESGTYEITVTPIKDDLKGDSATTKVEVEIDDANDSNNNTGDDDNQNSTDDNNATNEEEPPPDDNTDSNNG